MSRYPEIDAIFAGESEGCIICGDCLEVMKEIPDGLVDMVLADPPYGTTACKWDSIIPLEPMWEHLERAIKPNGAIVMTASQPFTTTLIVSNTKMFRYCWVWNKRKAGNFALGNKQCLKIHEDIVVFYNKQPTYNPQKIKLQEPQTRHLGKKSINSINSAVGISGRIKYGDSYEPDKKLPVSILEIKKDNYRGNIFHPTQKPVALMEYLIQTYTNSGKIVLDFTVGSGTTCVAAKKVGRYYIGIDIDEGYCNKARERLSKLHKRRELFDV